MDKNVLKRNIFEEDFLSLLFLPPPKSKATNVIVPRVSIAIADKVGSIDSAESYESYG